MKWRKDRKLKNLVSFLIFYVKFTQACTCLKAMLWIRLLIYGISNFIQVSPWHLSTQAWCLSTQAVCRDVCQHEQYVMMSVHLLFVQPQCWTTVCKARGDKCEVLCGSPPGKGSAPWGPWSSSWTSSKSSARSSRTPSSTRRRWGAAESVFRSLVVVAGRPLVSPAFSWSSQSCKDQTHQSGFLETIPRIFPLFFSSLFKILAEFDVLFWCHMR